jgi:hypothetical protein
VLEGRNVGLLANLLEGDHGGQPQMVAGISNRAGSESAVLNNEHVHILPSTTVQRTIGGKHPQKLLLASIG